MNISNTIQVSILARAALSDDPVDANHRLAECRLARHDQAVPSDPEAIRRDAEINTGGVRAVSVEYIECPRGPARDTGEGPHAAALVNVQ